MARTVCVPKSLSQAQAEIAARRSVEINPANAAALRTVERTPVGRRGGPRRLVLVTGCRWPETDTKLTVQFIETSSRALRNRILAHMNAWSEYANVSFVETHETGLVRIARFDSPENMAGYWSYTGTEILGIPDDEPTLNLEGFTMRTPEDEFRRVVRHEAGHTLGFEHEHLRAEYVENIDRRKAIAYFSEECGWTEEDTIDQALTPLSERSIIGTTELDPLSIMCYEIPAEITKDGVAITGGDDITVMDAEFAGQVYPLSTRGASARNSTVDPTAARLTETSPGTLSPTTRPDEFQIVIMEQFDPENKSETTPYEQRPRFAQVLASYGGARVSSVMRTRRIRGESPTGFSKIIDMHERIKDYTNLNKGTLPSDDQLIKFGTTLFDTLFQGDVRRLYDEARARRRNEKLDIVFTSMIPWIAEKPWEFAYDSVRRSFLATEEIHLVRNVLTAIPASVIPTRKGPLRILVVAAQPVGMGMLSIEQETKVIRRGFESLVDAGLVQIEVLARATPGKIHERLATGGFTIVLFIGHGKFDKATQEGSLIFENSRGGIFELNQRSVREVFCHRGVGLVFLNSCQSGSGGFSDFNKGVAQSLVAHGMPALVANQYSVLDVSATKFAKQFYWCLAHGMSIGQATCEARIAVNYSMQGELIDWAVPVVYTRDPNLRLSAEPVSATGSGALTKPAKSRATTPRSRVATQALATYSKRVTNRSTRESVKRVAVWDIDNVFPALDVTLERMNDAQNVFDFELVSLSPPLGIWDLDHLAKEKTPYLNAAKLAERLAQMPVELGVDVLACVTRNWMSDNDWLNLNGWWPVEKNPAVIVFSWAGFEELATEGLETDRAIANVAVTGLAGFLFGMGTHSNRAGRSCPMSFDESRDIERLTGQQKFDGPCRKRLEKDEPHVLAAFDRLLTAFD